MVDSRPPPGIPHAGAVGDAAARLGTPQGAGGGQGPTNALSPERYLAWLYMPPDRQRVFGALCQIEGEIAGSLRPGIDHHVAHARLQWWGEECERTAQGRPVHPLTRELVAASTAAGESLRDHVRRPASPDGSMSVTFGGGAARGSSVGTTDVAGGVAAGEDSSGDATNFSDATRLSSVGTTTASAVMMSPLAGISGFVDTAVWDLAGATFETRKELAAYCERWAAAMFADGVVRTHDALRAPDAVRTKDAVRTQGALHTNNAVRLRALGAAVREVELLAGLAREAHAGRLRVPLDELERAGIDPASLAKTPWPAPLAALLRERHEALRTTIAEGVSRFDRDEQPPLRGLLVWAALAWRLSWQAQRALPNAIAPRRYHALSAGWHAWRAAHRATAGKLRLH